MFRVPWVWLTAEKLLGGIIGADFTVSFFGWKLRICFLARWVREVRVRVFQKIFDGLVLVNLRTRGGYHPRDIIRVRGQVTGVVFPRHLLLDRLE
jgi:hypothetical protein